MRKQINKTVSDKKRKPLSRVLHKLLLTVFFVTTITLLSAQDSLVVKGVIVAENNQPVSGVSVSIEGSANLPVITGEDGTFMLKAASGNCWVIISTTSGYNDKRVFLDDRAELKIYVTSSALLSGDDQLTVFNHERLRKNIISSFSELSLNDIYHSGAITIDQCMQGKVPGFYTVNRSGTPASGAITTLRGAHSFNATNQPLFVVDGIPANPHSIFDSNLEGYEYNPLTNISVYDISNIIFVKDPAITAAYGSKGSNGIIFIETLDPSVTKTTIELDLQGGYYLKPEKYIPQLNAKQHKTLISEILFSSGENEEDIIENYPSLYYTEDDEEYVDYQHNTDWQKLIFDNASSKVLNLNVKGGDRIATYGLSFNSTNYTGIIKSTNYEGYNLRFVSRLNIFTWLKMNAGVSFNYSRANLREAATEEQTSPILTSLAKSPMLNPYQYDDDGNELKTLSEVEELGVSNPLATIENFEAENLNYNVMTNIGFEGRINKKLFLSSKFSYAYNLLKEEIFKPNHGMEEYYDGEAINVAIATNNDFKSFFNNTNLSYRSNFGANHLLTSVTGFNIHTNKFQLDWGLAKNSHESDQYKTISDGESDLREIGGDNRNWSWISFYEHLFYEYKDKYMLTLCLTMDGSSRVGEDAINTVKVGSIPYGLFYSGGIAWRVSNEAFFKNISWLEEAKLRFSFGKTGNDDIGESSATRYYQTIKYRSTTGLYPAVVENTELSYETVMQMNAGFDLSLLGNRFSATVDYYKSESDNLLVYSSLEEYLGYDMMADNGGKIENKGFEVSAFFRIISMPKFKWDLQANFSYNTNEVTQIEEPYITEIDGAEIVNQVGSPANCFYGYVFKGVYSTYEEANTADLVNDKDEAYQAGDAIYEDLSGPEGTPDGVIDDYDKTIIGSATPDYFGGITNSLSYGKFRLSATVYMVSGNDVFNYLRYKNESMTGLENQSKRVLGRWQYDGQVTDVPRALYDDPVGNSAFSSRWIEDGSYIRLKNITLSYKIPDKFLVFRNAEIYISANNLYTYSKYLGYDPEFAFSYSQSEQGIDYGQTPQSRQFIAGIKIGL